MANKIEIRNSRNSSKILFDRIIEVLVTKLSGKEEAQTIEKLTSNSQSLFTSTSETYRNSECSQSLLKKTLADILAIDVQTSSDVKSVFTILLPLLNEFKVHKMQKKPAARRVLTTPVAQVASPATTMTALSLNPPVAVSNDNDLNGTNLDDNAADVATTSSSNRGPLRGSKLARLTKERNRLIKIRQDLSDKINEEGEKVLDWDEMMRLEELDGEDYSLRRLDRMQAKVVKVEENLRILDGEIQAFGRPGDAVLTFKGSGYANIDRSLTKLINEPKIKKFQPRSVERMTYPKSAYNFPSKDEVQKIVRKENLATAGGLGLNENDFDDLVIKLSNDVMALIKKNTVKERRQVVEDWDFSNNSDVDPAAGNPILEKQLAENKIALKKEHEKLFANTAATSEDEKFVILPDLIRKEIASALKPNIKEGSTLAVEESLPTTEHANVEVASDVVDVEIIKAQDEPERNCKVKIDQDEPRRSVKRAAVTEDGESSNVKRMRVEENREVDIQTVDISDDPPSIELVSIDD